jgi:hypothetical protein
LSARRSARSSAWIFAVEARQVLLFSEHRRLILDDNDEFRPETIPGFAIRIGDLFDRY